MQTALHASVRLTHALGGPLVGEAYACLGVDLQVVPGAVGDELVRVDYGANEDHAAALGAALRFVGGVLPLLEGGRQLFGIRHDFEDARIVLAILPGQTHGADRHSAHDQGSIEGIAIVDGNGRAGSALGQTSSASEILEATQDQASALQPGEAA